MGKTTKQMSAGAGESGAEPVKKKATSRKVAARKGNSKSPGAKKTASTPKAASKRSVATKAVAKKAGAKSPVAKKTASSEKTMAKKSVAAKTVPTKAAPKKKVSTGAAVHRQISSDERRRMIAEAAYIRGESMGFLSDEQEDWLFAEAEVDSLLIGVDVIVID
jgi:hypothetical protein